MLLGLRLAIGRRAGVVGSLISREGEMGASSCDKSFLKLLIISFVSQSDDTLCLSTAERETSVAWGTFVLIFSCDSTSPALALLGRTLDVDPEPRLCDLIVLSGDPARIVASLVSS